MLTMNQITPYDPKKMVRLKAITALFFKGQRVEPGEEFEVPADQAGDCLTTRRADFANPDERHLVYKRVEHC